MKPMQGNIGDTHTEEIDWLTKHRRPWIFERILLVGEDAFTRNLRPSFKTNLFTLETASNCVDAVKKIIQSEFEVVVCDVTPRFPVETFYVAIERVRPYLVRRLLFLTGHDTDPDVNKFMRKSAAATLWKPYEQHVLFETIETVVGKTTSLVRLSAASTVSYRRFC
jgi:DNA-binding NarL/FixJ family response regulator